MTYIEEFATCWNPACKKTYGMPVGFDRHAEYGK